MACWVVPTIAAEFLGVSLEQILSRIDDGTIAHATEHGFVFVDVAPDASPSRPAPAPQERPPTFVAVTYEAYEATLRQARAEPRGEVDGPDAEPALRALEEAAAEAAILAAGVAEFMRAGGGCEGEAVPAEEPEEPEEGFAPEDEDETATWRHHDWQTVRQEIAVRRRGPRRA